MSCGKRGVIRKWQSKEVFGCEWLCWWGLQNGSTNDGMLLLQFTVGSMQLLNYICTFIIKSILILFEMKISGRHIGEMLKEAREQRQLTQEQLAQKVGKKRSYISKVETDYGNNIKLQTLKEIVEKGFDGTVKINLEL
jgi:DNA-binding XRE family transcriptional regulator